MAAHMLPKPRKGTATTARRARKRAADRVLSKNAATVRERDGHRCRVCGSRDRVEVHHIVYRSRGGDHSTGNLVCLCAGCHGRVHAGRLVLVGDADAGLFCAEAEPAVFDALDMILERTKQVTPTQKRVDGHTRNV